MMRFLMVHLPLAIVLMLSATLMLFGINDWSFWFDESFTSILVSYDYSEIISRTANDVHPPLYYLALKVWSSVFGVGDVALRSFSAVLMLASVGAVYGLVRRFASDHRVALASAFLAGIGPFVIRYGQEARMYAFASIILVLATHVLVEQLSRKKKKRSNLLWAAYAVLIAAALYTHYFTFPIVIAHALFVIYSDTKLEFSRKLSVKKIKKSWKKFDTKWLYSIIASGILFLPWLPTFIAQTGRVNDGFWISSVDHLSFVDALSQLILFEGVNRSGSTIAVQFFAVIAFVWLVAGAVWLWRRIDRSEKAVSVLLFGPIVFTAVILFLYSIPPFTSSVYYVRYFASTSALFYAGLGYALYLIWKTVSPKFASLIGLSLVVCMIGGQIVVANGWVRDTYTSNQAIAQLNGTLLEGDEVVVLGFFQQYDVMHYIRDGFTPRTLVPQVYYGGDSLLENRDELLLDSYEDVKPVSGTVWYVSDGRPIESINVPASWDYLETLYDAADIKVIRYIVN